MPRGLSHPSGPFSWDRNVRTRLHAFSGTVSNSGLIALPNCARLPVQGHRGSGSHHGHVGGTAGSEALLPTAPLCSSGSPLLLPPPRSCCTEFQSCCNAEQSTSFLLSAQMTLHFERTRLEWEGSCLLMLIKQL